MEAKEIGERIATFRKNKNMTQQQLADQLSLTNKAVSKWETGEGYPDITILPALAAALGTSIDDIMQDSESHPAVSQPQLKIRASLIYSFIVLAIMFFIIAFFPGNGIVDYIDPATLVFVVVIAFTIALVFMLLGKSRALIPYLLKWGFPLAGGVVAIRNAIFCLSRFSWDMVYGLIFAPLLYASLICMTIFVIRSLIATK